MNAYVWCWRKACGSLDENLLQWELAKGNQQTDPKVQQDFKGQYSKVKGQSVLHHDVAHLKPSTNVPTKYKLPTPYSL